jgi:D-serine deaminase-like pyridoxal phosphate-dependent protein
VAHLDESQAADMHSMYAIQRPAEIPSPALLVFRPVFEANLREMLRIAGSPARLRPHCKTHKIAEIVRRQLALGIARHKCATIAEAEMLARAGCPDVLLAYNPVGPNIARVVQLQSEFPTIRLSVLADDPEPVSQLGAAATSAGVTIGVLLDINPGRDRTGLPPGDEAAALYRHVGATPGVAPRGLHIYDGHQHQRELSDRRAAVAAGWEPINALRTQLERAGLPVDELVCGGTPTFPVYAGYDDPAVSLSPGTCVFHDAGYQESFPDLNGFTPAALVLTRVVSRPTSRRVTFDCGTKAIAADPPVGRRIVLPEIPDGQQVLHNEEHLVVESDCADQWNVGDWTLAIPRHVCPTTALYREVLVIDGGEVVETWPVAARDRRLTI